MEWLPREYEEQQELQLFSPHAMFSSKSKGRKQQEEQCPIRTDYARDRDRIIHCAGFRRLKHKTQMIFSPVGDHYRTRLTHTLEVSQIARTIARALRLNEDLTEAIALGHDMGHTPFGHSGERALSEVAPFPFRHDQQSVRMVEHLERHGKGLNLTYEVKDGIASHSSSTSDACTLEGKIVEYADKIAYVNHDIEDAIRAGILRQEELPYDCVYILGRTKSQRITTMITSIVSNSLNQPKICVEEEIWNAHIELRKFMFEHVYSDSLIVAEEEKANSLLKSLYGYFGQHSDKLPCLYQDVMQQAGIERALCDYIASMTDSYALNLYQELFLPKNSL